MAYKFQLRSDTSTNWSIVNPVLLQGEPGYEIDTRKIKYGDGVSAWNSLPYFVTSGGNGGGTPGGPNGSIQFNNSGALGGSANLVYNGANLVIAGSLVPSANITYGLGDVNHQWKDLWVSGNTIYIGNTTLATDANGGLTVGGNSVVTANGTQDFSDIDVSGNIRANALFANSLMESGNIVTGSIIANGSLTIGSLLVTGPMMAQQDVFFNTIHATEFLLSGPMVVNGDFATTGNLNAQNVIVNDLSIQAQVNAVDISASGTILANGISAVSLDAGSITSTGTIQASQFIGDGSQLTNLPVTYSNANVQSYLPTYTGNLSGNYIVVHDGRPTSFALAVQPTYVSIGKEAVTNITIADHGIEMLGDVSVTGNITGDYIFGNGYYLTGISGGGGGYSNADVAAYLPTDPTIIAIQGNVAALQTDVANLAADSYSNANVAAYLPVYSGALAGATAYVGGNNPGDYFLDIAADHASLGMFAGQNITVGSSGIQIAGTGGVHIMGVIGSPVILGGGTSGEIQVANNMSSSGNITAAKIAGSILEAGDAAITNLTVTDHISAWGNVTTDQYFIGNGAFLTGISAGSDYSNANVESFLASGTMTTDISTAGNIVGENLSATGNIYIGNTVFTRTLTVGRASSPVTVPLSSNNTLNVLTANGNVAVYTT